jgi:hypothetical protein
MSMPDSRKIKNSDLGGFRGWNNPGRFIIEIEILLEHIAARDAEMESLHKENARLKQELEDEYSADKQRIEITNAEAEAAESREAALQTENRKQHESIEQLTTKVAQDMNELAALREKLAAQVKKLPKYPYYTWDRKDDGNHQQLVGLDDVLAALAPAREAPQGSTVHAPGCACGFCKMGHTRW